VDAFASLVATKAEKGTTPGKVAARLPALTAAVRAEIESVLASAS
jgi:hypothetical protein